MVNIQFTHSTNEIFKQYEVPKLRFQRRYFGTTIKFPFGLNFEKTYYKRIGGNLVGFRILAYALVDGQDEPYFLSYLVQLPNQAPKWKNGFITPKSNIYTSVEEYVLSAGEQSTDLIWRDITYTNQVRFTKDLYYFNKAFYTIKDGAVCISNEGANCSCLFATKNGWLVGVQKDSYSSGEKGIYLNKADAMQELLNNMGVVDFAEEPINIDITILPNKERTTRIMFVE